MFKILCWSLGKCCRKLVIEYLELFVSKSLNIEPKPEDKSYDYLMTGQCLI